MRHQRPKHHQGNEQERRQFEQEDRHYSEQLIKKQESPQPHHLRYKEQPLNKIPHPKPRPPALLLIPLRQVQELRRQTRRSQSGLHDEQVHHRCPK